MKTSSKIDITMTAVIRPKILNETLKSFCKRVFCDLDRFRLIINIDNVGEDSNPFNMIKICHKFFKDVKWNIAVEPSFSKAVKWVWSQVENDFVFHLEDDWIIFRKIEFNNILRIMSKNSNIASIKLCNKKLKVINGVVVLGDLAYTPINEFCIAIDKGRSMSLNPSLIRASFIKEVLPFMSDNVNPEKQLRKRNPLLKKIIMKYDYAIYGNPGDGALVYGKNGLNWRKNYGFSKVKKNFITWEGNVYGKDFL